MIEDDIRFIAEYEGIDPSVVERISRLVEKRTKRQTPRRKIVFALDYKRYRLWCQESGIDPHRCTVILTDSRCEEQKLQGIKIEEDDVFLLEGCVDGRYFYEYHQLMKSRVR